MFTAWCSEPLVAGSAGEPSGMPVIELTTTGRRSGQPRATMLTSPYQEGSTIAIVALTRRR